MTVDPRAKLNLLQSGIAGVTTMFNMNAWTSAALMNIPQFDKHNNYIALGNENFDYKNFTLNVVAGGIFGSASGKATANIGPTAGVSFSQNGVMTVANTLANIWGNAFGGAAANAGISEINSLDQINQSY